MKRQKTIITNVISRLKINNPEIVPVNKSNVVVITYTKDIHEKTFNFINNNNTHTLNLKSTVHYT